MPVVLPAVDGPRAVEADAGTPLGAGAPRVPYVWEPSVDKPWSDFALVQQLVPEAPRGGDRFGDASAVSAHTILVGSAQASSMFGDAEPPPEGAVYVFERTDAEWQEADSLVLYTGIGDPEEDWCLGCRLGVGQNHGYVYWSQFDGIDLWEGHDLISRGTDGWTKEEPLDLQDPGLDGVFFRQQFYLTPNDELLVGLTEVGADFEAIDFKQGEVQLFERRQSGWQRQDVLRAPDGHDENSFGHVLARSGDTILIGAPGDDEQGEQTGAAYFFGSIQGAWMPVHKLTAESPTERARFPSYLALDGDRAIVRDPDRPLRPLRCLDGEWARGPPVPVAGGQPSIVRLSEGTIALLVGNDVQLFAASGGDWAQKQTILDPRPTQDFVVRSVELRGNVLGIGMRNDEAAEGVVLVYERP